MLTSDIGQNIAALERGVLFVFCCRLIDVAFYLMYGTGPNVLRHFLKISPVHSDAFNEKLMLTTRPEKTAGQILTY